MSNVSDFESRRSALIAEIMTAFDGVPREDGTTLHEADAQRKAVAKFLRFIIDFDEIKADRATVEAAVRWERFCAGA
jgi:hypothetical protein